MLCGIWYLPLLKSENVKFVHGDGRKAYELLLSKHDGTQLSFLVQDNPVITFIKDDSFYESNVMIVMSKSTVIEIPTHELDEITVTDGKISGVKNLIDSSSDISYHYNDEILWIRNSEENARILLTGTDGLTYINRLIPIGEFPLPLAQLTKGIYVLTINGKSIKIKK